MLGDLEHEALALVLGLQRVQDRRQVAFELHVDDGADDLGDVSGGIGHEGLLKAWKGQTAVSVTGTLPRVAFE